METPSTPNQPISDESVNRCVQVLEQLIDNRLLLSAIEPEKRRALLMAAGRISRPDRLELTKLARLRRRGAKKALRMQDRDTRAKSGIREARKPQVFLPPSRVDETEATTDRRLHHPRQCYVCKIRYSELHFFYDCMCRECGDLNYEKRFQTARLDGRVALITGARLKIGYQSALKMLQAGARVIVTTRFPNDAAIRFAKEPDFEKWQDRLHVHGLDLRHAPSVDLFCGLVESRYDRLDYLINNAAQTVRRPPGFYSHLMEWEAAPFESLPSGAQAVLAEHEQLKRRLNNHSSHRREIAGRNVQETAKALAAGALHDPRPGIGIRQSAALSQIPYHFEDMSRDEELFPAGKLDADLQQVDLRARNTWRLKIGEVTTPEMLEVQLINSVAPFILCGRLRPLMSRDFTGEKHIINVSAMEGKFARHTKTDKHPHTNMAKAALNMLTLTSAPDLAEVGIYMNAVDTGWVTDEDPVHLMESKQREHDFFPPLDIVDGAARVLDPIFAQKLTGEAVWGKFLKDYAPTAW